MTGSKLFGCGCSFMCQDLRYPEHKTFLEQFAEANGLNYTSLAFPGATNYSIRLQIDWAIEQNADYVIVAATGPDRIHLVDEHNDPPLPIRLENIRHSDNGAPCNFPQRHAYVLANPIKNLLRGDFNNNKQQALVHYFTDIYNVNLQSQIDVCVLRDGLNSLERASIPYMFIPGPFDYFDWSNYSTWPTKQAQPWSMPNGHYDLYNNHNDDAAHQQFFSTLQDSFAKVINKRK